MRSDEKKEEIPKCKRCKEIIEPRAKVCKHCRSHQNGLAYIFQYYIGVISILLFLISFSQLWLAMNERNQAEEALRKVKVIGKTLYLTTRYMTYSRYIEDRGMVHDIGSEIERELAEIEPYFSVDGDVNLQYNDTIKKIDEKYKGK